MRNLLRVACLLALARPLCGADLALQGSVFADVEGIGAIQTLSANPCGQGVVAGGRLGAAFLEAGRPPQVIAFRERAASPRPIDLDGDGICEFFDQGGGWSKVGTIDRDGAPKWVYRHKVTSAPDEMEAGDLDGDGRPEFVVGLNGAGGVVVLGGDGKEKHRWPARNVFSVEIADIDADGRPEILHSDVGKGIVVRRAAGEVIRTFPGIRFEIVPRIDGTPLLASFSGRQLTLRELDGREIAVRDVPDSSFSGFDIAYVRFVAGAPPFLVAARTLSHTGKRTAFYVWDSSGKLALHGGFAVAASPLHVIRGEKTDTLLIAEGSRIWKLTP